MKYIIIILVSCLGVFSDAWASDLLQISIDDDHETISLNLDDISPRKVFRMANPDRLVVDVPTAEYAADIALPRSYDGKLIKAVRYGQFNPQTTRLVFDLTQPVQVVKIRDDKSPLMVELAPAEEREVKPHRREREAEAPPPPPIKKKQTVAKWTKPLKPIIVIDPGHGGVDPGTMAEDGTMEKNIVLEYAKSLKAKLLKSGKYEVLLTREDDTFIMLRQRVEIARKDKATLFVSLHADSAPDDVRGLSVYTLSEKSSDEEAEALAARENKSDVLAGMDLNEEREDVADILISLAQRETKNRSATFADLLVTGLDDKVELLPNSHRFAGFAVLKAPDVPSVLIEIGFLSHPDEEKLLKSKAYREKVTSGIAAGIDSYFKTKNP